jgi:hypothetical protein
LDKAHFVELPWNFSNPAFPSQCNKNSTIDPEQNVTDLPEIERSDERTLFQLP